jgi:hypothetical protein
MPGSRPSTPTARTSPFRCLSSRQFTPTQAQLPMHRGRVSCSANVGNCALPRSSKLAIALYCPRHPDTEKSKGLMRHERQVRLAGQPRSPLATGWHFPSVWRTFRCFAEDVGIHNQVAEFLVCLLICFHKRAYSCFGRDRNASSADSSGRKRSLQRSTSVAESQSHMTMCPTPVSLQVSDNTKVLSSSLEPSTPGLV